MLSVVVTPSIGTAAEEKVMRMYSSCRKKEKYAPTNVENGSIQRKKSEYSHGTDAADGASDCGMGFRGYQDSLQVRKRWRVY